MGMNNIESSRMKNVHNKLNAYYVRLHLLYHLEKVIIDDPKIDKKKMYFFYFDLPVIVNKILLIIYLPSSCIYWLNKNNSIKQKFKFIRSIIVVKHFFNRLRVSLIWVKIVMNLLKQKKTLKKKISADVALKTNFDLSYFTIVIFLNVLWRQK